ncbi:MAG: S1C family serine protease [Proteobacteria bacterium]|nr:S1C family serine protease [Pseudomonadota bacterium]
MKHFPDSFLVWLLLCAVLAALPVRAQDAAQGPKAISEKRADELLASVVKVRTRALPNARSNASLGSVREGSGVIIDDRGYVLTIGYLVIEADTIEVTTAEGKTSPATLAGYDHATGFGLLRPVLPLGAKPIDFGASGELALREPVMVAPFGGRDSINLAYVLSKREFAGSWEYMLDSAIFTSPPTLAWAGSALISREGKLVGIGSLLVRDSEEAGTPLPGNMFVPIDLIKPILADLIDKGRASGEPRPWLGMATEELQGRLFVTRVSADAPADKAGVQRGDIIVGVGADAVTTHAELYRKVWSLGPAGTEVPLKVLQGASVKEIKLRSIDRMEYFRAKPTL